MPQSVPQSSAATLAPNLAAHATEPRFAFIHANWHQDIVMQALQGFQAEMQRMDVAPDAIDVFAVPGAFELPLLARTLARSNRYAAVVACALVVDGGIYRHDFVAAAVVQGLMDVQLEVGVPVLSVVLTPHQFQPCAEHHAFFASHFVVKGAEAARACLQTVLMLRRAASGVLTSSEPGDDGGGPSTMQ